MAPTEEISEEISRRIFEESAWEILLENAEKPLKISEGILKKTEYTREGNSEKVTR